MKAESIQLFDPAQPTSSEQIEVGGKAGSLVALQAAGFAVPDFVVIPANELAKLLPAALTAKGNWKEIQTWIETSKEVSPILEQVRIALEAQVWKSGLIAVRSSAMGEDAMGLSYAGIFDSVLEVEPLKVEAAIRKVWASAWSARVQTYHQQNEVLSPPKMAILIQKMVPAEVAGVLFGINPVSGNRKEKVVSATLGLGDQLVMGLVEGDRYVVQADGEYTAHLHQESPCLNADQIGELARLADRIRSHFHYFPDIEFAYAKGKLWVLQSRPISQSQLPLDPEGVWAIWDRSNIMESYPGLTSPLTFSFVRKTYENGYTQLAELLVRGSGIPNEVLDKNKPYFANMVGLIEGRMHYNLMTYYRLLSMLPGFTYTSRFLEGILGVLDSFDYEKPPPVGKWKERWRIFRLGLRLIKVLRKLRKSIEVFEREFDEVVVEFRAMNLGQLSPHELMYLYLDLETRVVKRWKPPVVNGFFTMIFFGVLRSLVKKWKVGGENANIHNDLLVGEGNIISTEPVRLLVELTDLVRQNPEAEATFRSQSPQNLYLTLQKGAYPSIYAKIQAYLDKFGERCIGGELKLENIPYKHDPAKFLKILKSYLDQEVKINFSHNDVKIREDAEQEVRKNLKGSPVKKWIFFRLIKLVRFLVTNRENLRYTRTTAWGMVREVFVRLGSHFFAEGLLDSHRDIFWLSKDEVFDYIQGTSVNRKLRPLVELRKREYAQYEASTPQERIISKGVVYDKNDFYSATQIEVELEGDKLMGVGCCAGRVRGKVRVVLDPDKIKNLDGDILVAHSTDPGWVKLFPTASAILLERGSLLSHTGIVTREMGIPCVVTIKGLLKHVKDGDEIEMDGGQGWVRIIDPKNENESGTKNTP